MGSDGLGANPVDGNLELTPVATALPARSEMHAVKKTKQTPTKPSNGYFARRSSGVLERIKSGSPFRLMLLSCLQLALHLCKCDRRIRNAPVSRPADLSPQQGDHLGV